MNAPSHPAETSTQERPEIERKFLLRGVPALPASVESWRIEQGYLNESGAEESAHVADLAAGRLRRVRFPNGSIEHVHTIKTGVGLVRNEIERRVSAEEFARHWPRTAGRRLNKVRHRVRDGGLIWEIDVFEGLDLVLAEVELPSADASIEFPRWLAPHIAREVTDDANYTNAAIAARLGAKANHAHSPEP